MNKFFDYFSSTMLDHSYSNMIKYSDVSDWLGYKKDTVVSILKNNKYNFDENDYKIKFNKKDILSYEIYMKIDTIKAICLLSLTKKGHQFRKYYIKMEKLLKKYISTLLLNKLYNPIPQINAYDFDINKYKNKETLYLINIKKNV